MNLIFKPTLFAFQLPQSYSINGIFRLTSRFVNISDNGLRLGEGGDFTTELSYEAHTSNLRKTVIRSTEPPLLPNRCYQLPFWPSKVLSCQVCTELLHCPRAMACTLFCFFWVGLCGCKKANVSANAWALYALTLRLQVSLSAYNFIFKFHQIQTCQNYYKRYSNVCGYGEN